MANERNELISSDRCRYSVNVLDNIEREMRWMGTSSFYISIGSDTNTNTNTRQDKRARHQSD